MNDSDSSVVKVPAKRKYKSHGKRYTTDFKLKAVKLLLRNLSQ